MKIAIICVCYNTYTLLIDYLKSIENSLENFISESIINFEIIIMDNSSIHNNTELLYFIDNSTLSIKYVKSNNIGYFPSLSAGLSLLSNIIDYNYIIISNVDLKLDNNFFNKLISINFIKCGVIAPSIISESRGGDLNPKKMIKPKKIEIIKNLYIFRVNLLFKFYNFLSSFKTRSKSIYKIKKTSKIYSAHGSFFILTNEFFVKGGDINYPRFLFGEEFYVAEKCKELNLDIIYEPSLIVYDSDHGSTSKEKISFISEEHIKSLKYILNYYY